MIKSLIKHHIKPQSSNKSSSSFFFKKQVQSLPRILHIKQLFHTVFSVLTARRAVARKAVARKEAARKAVAQRTVAKRVGARKWGAAEVTGNVSVGL